MHTDITSLRRGFTGQILRPMRMATTRARRVRNAMADKRPAVSLRCAATSGTRACVNPGKDIRDARQGHQLRHRLLPGRHQQP